MIRRKPSARRNRDDDGDAARNDLPKAGQTWLRKGDEAKAIVRQCYPAKPSGHTVIFSCSGVTCSEGLTSFRARYRRRARGGQR